MLSIMLFNYIEYKSEVFMESDGFRDINCSYLKSLLQLSLFTLLEFPLVSLFFIFFQAAQLKEITSTTTTAIW